MAEECGTLFLRLGHSPDKTIAALRSFPINLTKVVQQKKGCREAYRDLLVATIIDLWKRDAMTFFEKSRVERVMRAVITAVVPGVDVPTIAYGPAIEIAEQEWNILRDLEKAKLMEGEKGKDKHKDKVKEKEAKHREKEKPLVSLGRLTTC